MVPGGRGGDAAGPGGKAVDAVATAGPPTTTLLPLLLRSPFRPEGAGGAGQEQKGNPSGGDGNTIFSTRGS